MTYPPPPGALFLAYQFGKITKEEFWYLSQLWVEKHRKEKTDNG